MKFVFAVLVALFFVTSAHAVLPDEMLQNPQLEARARALSEGFRCLVCQNQNIDESDATLARDLRLLIREQLVQNKSDFEITAYIVARYGDYVLLRPSFNRSTWALWLAPFLLLLIGVMFLASRRRAAQPATEALTREEERQLKQILAADTKKP